MLVAPTMPVEPPTLEVFNAVTNAPPEAVVGLMKFTIPFNAAGIPTLTLPMGKTETGVPLGFQLIGPELGEAALCAAGAAYEQVADYASDHPAL